MTVQTLAAPDIELRSYGREYRSHRHDFHQFVLPMTGVLELDTPSGARRVDAGNGVVIPSGQRHGFAGRGANHFVVVDVASDWSTRLFERSVREPAIAIDHTVRHHLAFVAERRLQTRLSEHFRRHWCALLIETLEAYDRTPTGIDTRFVRATRWIDRHLGVALHARDVATAIGISPERLRTLFHEKAGCTPREWIASARLERAARELATTGRPIAEIALGCGFSDQSAFTRAFTRAYGDPPARWRRRCGTPEH